MKTIEIKWIGVDNHVVAEDAYNYLEELIDTGVFPDLTVKCEYDTLYITGEREDLDKAVMKIQKDYAKYGQIMIKEAKNGVNQELRIESFDENVQDIFNHTLDDYNKFKSSKERPLNYVKQLNDYRFKFKQFYETAARSDKKLLKPYLDEISNLLDESEFMPKIKPIKKINEDSLDDFDDREINARIAAQSAKVKKFVEEQQNLIYNYVKNKWISLCEKYKIDRDTYYEVTCDTSFGNGLEPGSTFFMLIKIDYLKQFLNAINARNEEEAEKWLFTKFCSDDCPFKISPAWKPEVYNSGDYEYRIRMGFIIPELPKKTRKPRKPRDPNKGYMKESVDNELTKHLGNLKNWGVVENMNRKQYNAKYDKVALAYARETGMDLDDAYDELMDVDELVNWIEGPYDVYEIVDKLMNESTNMN